MKIAFVTFPILDSGGITTRTEGMITGAIRLGHEAQHYYIDCKTRYSCYEDRKDFVGSKVKRGEKLPAIFLSYLKNRVKETVNVLNQYDVIVFTHPAPHPNRGQLRKENPLGWLDLYKKTTPPKIVVFSDQYWKKTNDWFVFASKYIDLLLGSQLPLYPAVKEYPTKAAKGWYYYPFNLERSRCSHKRKNFGITTQQWIKWKNHHKLLPALSGIDVKIKGYNCGQEYWEMRKRGDLGKFFHYDGIMDEWYKNDEPMKHKYYGFLTRDELISAYKGAMFCIDSSVRGYNNNTHFEPMVYGCISMVHETVLENEYNSIPVDCCVSYNWDNIKEQIKFIQSNSDEVKRIRRNAYDFVNKNCNCVVMVESMLKKLFYKKTSEKDCKLYKEHISLLNSKYSNILNK